MQFSDFYNKLYSVSNSYRWEIDEHNKITAVIQTGPLKGFTLNPITALAHKAGIGIFEDTRDATEHAASFLGIPRSIARHIYSATLASFNHGNVQVVRGRIRSVLEV